jgi:hypothetical protein
MMHNGQRKTKQSQPKILALTELKARLAQLSSVTRVYPAGTNANAACKEQSLL